MNLDYLKKTRIEQELDKIIFLHFKLASKNDGTICKKCKVIQGKPFKGFKKYYCEHLTRRIDMKLKKQKERVAIKIMDLVCQDAEITA